MSRQSTTVISLFLLSVTASALLLEDARISRPPQQPEYLTICPSPPQDGNAPSSRRDFVERGLAFVAFSSTMIVGNPGSAVAGDDPFAQLDSFASSLTTGQPTLPNNDDKIEASIIQPQASISALDAVLEESRKRKAINPRTHG